jgi:membrane protein required for colicin V production
MSSIALNGFDFFVVAVIGFSTLFAFLKGFIKTALSFFGLIFAAFIAYHIMPFVKPFLKGQVPNIFILNIAASVASYVVALIITWMINYKLDSLTKSWQHGVIDRSLGFAFGLIRGCLILALVFWMLGTFSPMLGFNKDSKKLFSSENDRKYPVWVVKSQSYGLVRIGNNMINYLFPKQFSKSINSMASAMLPDMSDPKDKEEISIRKIDPEVIGKVIDLLPKEYDSVISPELIIKLKDGNLTKEQQQSALDVIINTYKSAVKKGKTEPKLSEKELQEIESLIGK